MYMTRKEVFVMFMITYHMTRKDELGNSEVEEEQAKIKKMNVTYSVIDINITTLQHYGSGNPASMGGVRVCMCVCVCSGNNSYINKACKSVPTSMLQSHVSWSLQRKP